MGYKGQLGADGGGGKMRGGSMAGKAELGVAKVSRSVSVSRFHCNCNFVCVGGLIWQQVVSILMVTQRV